MEIGQRVGVGLIAGEDGVCGPCRRGDTVNGQNPVVLGVTADGGYAEAMIAEARGIASIPDELSSAEAAPLLCAGVTTYNALRNAGLRGGDCTGDWWPWASGDSNLYSKFRAPRGSGNFVDFPCKRHQRSHLVFFALCFASRGQGFESAHVHQNHCPTLRHM
jgi:Alcohol dehydrogenase GroES-like domain